MSTTPDASTERKDPFVTIDQDKFEDELRPGDLLLFDTMMLFSHLIKLADNRPVNHCAVYLGEDKADPGTHKVAHCTAPPKDDPKRCIRIVNLSDVMDFSRVRTVTALRHVDIVNGASADPVIARAKAFAAQSVRYANVDLARLAGACLYRAYRGELAQKEASTIIGLLRRAAKLGNTVDGFRNIATERKGGDPVGMTCSYFAYRCYAKGANSVGGDSLPIDLREPLGDLDATTVLPPGPGPVDPLDSIDPTGDTGEESASYTTDSTSYSYELDPTRFVYRRRGRGIDTSVTESELEPELELELELELPALDYNHYEVPGLRFHSALVDPSPAEVAPQALGTDDVATQGLGGGVAVIQGFGRELRAQLAERQWARNGFINVLRVSLDRDEEIPAGPSAANVTPRDLWGSDSFQAVAVFHRPPGGWKDNTSIDVHDD